MNNLNRDRMGATSPKGAGFGANEDDDDVSEGQIYKLVVAADDGRSIRDHLATLIDVCDRWVAIDPVDADAVRDARAALYKHLSRLAEPKFPRPQDGSNLVRIAVILGDSALAPYPWERLEFDEEMGEGSIAKAENFMISRTVGQSDSKLNAVKEADHGIARYFPEHLTEQEQEQEQEKRKQEQEQGRVPDPVGKAIEAARQLSKLEDPMLEELFGRQKVEYRKWVDGTPLPLPRYLILNPSLRRSRDGVTVSRGSSGRDHKSMDDFIDHIVLASTRHNVRPRLILLETFAIEPSFDAERSTAMLAHALAQKGIADVAFICHPRSASYPSAEDQTFAAQLISGIERGRKTSEAFYKAWRSTLNTTENTEESFGIPGLYVVERASASDDAEGPAQPTAAQAPTRRESKPKLSAEKGAGSEEPSGGSGLASRGDQDPSRADGAVDPVKPDANRADPLWTRGGSRLDIPDEARRTGDHDADQQ